MVKTVRLAHRIAGCLLLTRPGNVAIVIVSVAVGSHLSGGLRSVSVLFACISAGLILAGGNAVNDVCDLRIDRINNPGRPIPAGIVTRRAGVVLGGILFLLGMAASSIIGPVAFSIAGCSSVLLAVYALWAKRQMVVGNLLVSTLTALAFIYGGVAGGRPEGALFPALFAFLFHLGREIVKDVQDVRGDREAYARTLPGVFGERAGILLAAAVFALLVVVTPLPFMQGLYGYVYLIMVLVGVDLVLAVIIASLLSRRRWMDLRRASTLIKMDMVVGLAALLVGRL